VSREGYIVDGSILKARFISTESVSGDRSRQTDNRRGIFAPPFKAGISCGSFMIVWIQLLEVSTPIASILGEAETHPSHHTFHTVTCNNHSIPRIRRPLLQQFTTDTIRQESGTSHDDARVLVVQFRSTFVERSNERVFALEIEWIDSSSEFRSNVR